MQHKGRLIFFEEYFSKRECIGVELGVASGSFSSQLLDTCPKLTLYSIDRWSGDRGHGENELTHTRNKLRKFESRSIIIKESFEDAVVKFEDEFFDFIYIDGYAHTGQEEGQTLDQWIVKLKKGGIFAGHDYDSSWPDNMKAIDLFASKHNFNISVIKDDPFDSWYIQND